MNNIFTLTLHVGRRNKEGFGTRFKVSAKTKGDKPYTTALSMMNVLDKELIERTGLEIILDINGIFIPNDFEGKGYTIEEAYHHAMESDIDLLLDKLMDALTGEHNND